MKSWRRVDVPEVIGHGDRTPPSLFNSSTAQLQLAPLEVTDRPCSVYVCGITPYDATHIGHANTYIAFDLLIRTWLDAGFDVRYVQNVTDVDDPLLERATLLNRDWTQIAEEQIELYRTDMEALRVLPPDEYVGAIETIPEVVDAITGFLDQGIAYRVDLPEGAGGDQPDLGDVYFDLSRDALFGSVSRWNRREMVAVFADRGGDPDRVGKRNELDPLLWRRVRPGEPSWNGGVLGEGRPGWHIECAVIATHNLPVPFDVQGGGSDLIFPHHEMSAAHGEALTGVDDFAYAYVHAGMVAYEGEKMSKSKGNLVFVSQLRRDGVDPMVIRTALCSHHYRDDWEWEGDMVATAEQRLNTWRSAIASPNATGGAQLIDQIRSHLHNDVDAPAACQSIDEWAEKTLADSRATTPSGNLTEEGQIVRDGIDALLGII